MATTAAIAEMMTALGKLLDLERVVEAEPGVAWIIGVDGQRAILVEHDAEAACLHLSADLPAVPPAQRIEIYELLLLYNAQWQATGGIRMALDAPGGAVEQVVTVPMDGLDVTVLATVVTRFFEKMVAWELVLSRQAATADATEGDDTPPGADILFI